MRTEPHELPGPTLRITPWERSTLRLLANGSSRINVAIELGMSPFELDGLLTRLFAAMGAATQAEAIAAAHRRGLLTRDSSELPSQPKLPRLEAR